MKTKSLKKTECGEWIVDMTCTVKKEVICSGCTEAEAKSDPWQYATAERELSMPDWELQGIEPNE